MNHPLQASTGGVVGGGRGVTELSVRIHPYVSTCLCLCQG